VGQVDWGQVFCVLCSRAAVADGLANLTLFLPLGAALELVGCRRHRAFLSAAGLSLCVELAQFLVPGRDPSLSDVIFNTLGAAVGGGIVRLAPRWVYPRTPVASRLSLLAALATAVVFAATDFLLTVSLPDTTYFGGSPSIQLSDKPLRLGGNLEPQGYFQGRIDEVRVYRRERTPLEVLTDMNTPVAVSPVSPDLVAAYSFDEGAGSVLIDISGHGNTGQIHGANWTTQGRFGGALVFDGLGAVVVIPPGPSLGLTAAMTLEAWIYPTAEQRGWRTILQKEFDAYFLLAGSRAGALRPGGGGTFGSSTETLAARSVVPTNAWTHVALTYDAGVLGVYINGHLTRRRLRWYPGQIVAATLDGLTIPAGLSVESRRLRALLLSGAQLRVIAIAAAPVTAQAPLVTLHDALRNEILLLAAQGDDIVFRLRTRAAAAELDSPAIRAHGVLRRLSPGSAMTVTMWRPGRSYCVDVNGHSACGLAYTLGVGWTFFVYSQVPLGWPHAALNMMWMAALLVPFGFWLRRRWESVLGALVLAACVVLLCTIGSSSVSWAELGAAAAGIAVGSACALGVARVRSTA